MNYHKTNIPKTMLAHGKENNFSPFANPRRRGKRCSVEDVRQAMIRPEQEQQELNETGGEKR